MAPRRLLVKVAFITEVIVRTAERWSHWGRTTRTGRSLEDPGYLDVLQWQRVVRGLLVGFGNLGKAAMEA